MGGLGSESREGSESCGAGDAAGQEIEERLRKISELSGTRLDLADADKVRRGRSGAVLTRKTAAAAGYRPATCARRLRRAERDRRAAAAAACGCGTAAWRAALEDGARPACAACR